MQGKVAADELARLQEERTEMVKNKFVNLLVVGRKGALAKMFRGWLVGMKVYKKERVIDERDRAWRKSCSSCLDGSCVGACGTHERLRDTGFQLPTDAALRSTGLASSGDTRLFTLPRLLNDPAAALAIAAPGRTFVDPFGARSARPRISFDDGGQRSASSPALHATLPAAPPREEACRGLMGASRWPCRCARCDGRRMTEFFDVNNAEPMIHFKTGRRCLVDPATMRMTFADVTRQHVRGSTQSLV